MLGYIFTCIFKIRLCPRRLRPAAIDVLGLALSPSNVDLSSNRIRSRKSSNARRISIAARSQANQTWRAPRSPRSSRRFDPRPPVPTVVAFCGRRVRRRSDLRSLSSRSAVVVGRLPASSQPRRLSTTRAAAPATERPNVHVAVAPDRLAPHNLGPPPRDDHGDLVDDVHRRHLVDDSASLGLRCTGTPRLRDTTTTASPTGDRVVEGLRHGVEGADPRWNSCDAASVASSSSSRDT